jgi:hypothetical protein
MKLAIMFAAAAVLWAGTFIAHAQDADPGIAPAVRTPTPNSTPNDRPRTRQRAENEYGTAGYAEVARGSAGGPLPNHFRDCYEPIPPWCRRY